MKQLFLISFLKFAAQFSIINRSEKIILFTIFFYTNNNQFIYNNSTHSIKEQTEVKQNIYIIAGMLDNCVAVLISFFLLISLFSILKKPKNTLSEYFFDLAQHPI